MRAHHNIDLARLEPGDDLARLLGRGEAAEQLNADGVLEHPGRDGRPVLEGPHGGRRKDGGLPAPGDALEGGADGHLCFAETDVAADEAVHGLARFHVCLRLVDGAQLVGRFTPGEAGFKLPHPAGVCRVGARGVAFSLGLYLQHLRGVVCHGAFGGLAGALPTGIPQAAEFRRFGTEPHVFGDEVALAQGNAQQNVSGVFNVQFLFAALLVLHNASKPAKPVRGVDDEVTLLNLAQRSLRAFAAQLVLPVGLQAGMGGGVAAEDFCGREDGKARPGHGEAEGQVTVLRAHGAPSLILSADFIKTLLFSGVGEEHDHAPLVALPLLQACACHLAASLLHHEVTRFKGAERRAEEGSRFGGSGGIHTAEVCVIIRQHIKAVGRGFKEHDISRHPGAGQAHHPVFGCNPTRQFRVCRGLIQHQFGRIKLAERELGVHIKGADALHCVAKELHAQGRGRLQGEDIQNAAAQTPLPPRHHLLHALKAVLRELGRELFRRGVGLNPEGEGGMRVCAEDRGFLPQGGGGEHGYLWCGWRAGEFFERGKAFGGEVRVAEAVVDMNLLLGQEDGAFNPPERELGGNALLRGQGITDHPHAARGSERERLLSHHSRHKGKGGGAAVVKDDGCIPRAAQAQPAQLPRKRRGVHDELCQWLCHRYPNVALPPSLVNQITLCPRADA